MKNVSKKRIYCVWIFKHLLFDTGGVISTSSSQVIDYEALTGHTIVMSVTVSDGNAQDVKELIITVTNQNEPPEFQYEDYSISGNEGEVVVLLLHLYVHVFLFIHFIKNDFK